MTANALAKTDLAAETASGSGAARPKNVRRGEAIRELKKRDNHTNFYHIGFVYLVIAATIAATIWSYHLVAAQGLGWWWDIPMTIAAITVIGASQHQFGGAIHEGTHSSCSRIRS
jgi:hypothetical protein